MKRILGTDLLLCLICEDDAATTTISDIGPVCAECSQCAIDGQQACLAAGIGPETISGSQRNNRVKKS